MTKYKLFEPCRSGEEADHQDCATELWQETDAGGYRLLCSCECHVEWQPDAAYNAGYQYAAGYHD